MQWQFLHVCCYNCSPVDNDCNAQIMWSVCHHLLIVWLYHFMTCDKRLSGNVVKLKISVPPQL